MRLQRLFVLVIPLLCSFVRAPIVKNQRGLTVFLATPLSYNDTSTFYFKYESTYTNKLVVKVRLINDLYKDGIEICNKTFSSYGESTFEYSNEYTRANNKIELLISFGLGKTPTSIIGDIDFVNSQFQYANTFNNENSARNFVYKINEGISYIKEGITFDTFDDYYVPSYYHKLDITQFTMTLDSDYQYNIQLSKGYLNLNNINGKFSNLSNGKGSLSLNLSINKIGEHKYSLMFMDELYVNQSTLDMSYVKKEGYVKTNYLYFPINEMINQENYDLSIALLGLGANRDTVVHNFTFRSLLNLMGNCHTSEYCVVNYNE